MKTNRDAMDRRAFLGVSTSCSAHLALMMAGAPALGRRFFAAGPQRRIAAQEAWGRLEEIGDGLWALISTPLDGDRTTLCNGGIIRGTDGALVVEGFASADGAAWMARMTRELTGRWPSHVVLTHYHGDHANGFEGYYRPEAPVQMLATATTRDLIRDTDARRDIDPDGPRAAMLADVTIVNPVAAANVDLGGRTVRIIPRSGHTPSDVTVEMDGAGVVYCGDLVWNNMFPNYRDAIPSRLSRSVRTLVQRRASIYVPGHGALATSDDLDRYVSVIDDVEAAARRAFEQGVPAEDAARDYRLPATLGEWVMFNPRYYEVALGAWERELTGN